MEAMEWRAAVTDLDRLAKTFAGDYLLFIKKQFYGEISNLISKRSNARTR
jgi:hypothetical protein